MHCNTDHLNPKFLYSDFLYTNMHYAIPITCKKQKSSELAFPDTYCPVYTAF